MGAWGYQTFQDDTACDWIYELQDSEDPIIFLRESLTPQNDEYLDYDDGCAILGACEAIYGIMHGSREPDAEEFTAWVNEHRALNVEGLRPLAAQSAGKVLGNNSELKELWQENEEFYPKWRANIEAMIKGISG